MDTKANARRAATQGSALPPEALPEPKSVAETGLGLSFLSDLVLKASYFEGVLTGHELMEVVRLPFQGVLSEVLKFLRREQFIQVTGTEGVGEASYRYTITEYGSERARQVLDRSQYVGPAPVPLDLYRQVVAAQSLQRMAISPASLREALKHLVLPDEFLDLLGPAVNSARSIFLYGDSGNGKTVVAEGVRDMLGGQVWIPYAVEADGAVIKVFDPLSHEPLPAPDERRESGLASALDRRWVLAKRPVVIVGGELTMKGLDLVYNESARYYEAPFQMKANGGMFLIDDFGRQLVRPRDLLNRWIVPLEKRIDFLTLHTGKKIEVPFDVLIIFATNLEPRDLVDEAFLRRIRHKIEMSDPTYDQYREIFRGVCQRRGVVYEEQALAYLLKEHYLKPNRPLRACHPRDIVDELVDIAQYMGSSPRLTKDLIDRACAAYFVDI
jgi:DNA-binding PadR family transcriptional regulator